MSPEVRELVVARVLADPVFRERVYRRTEEDLRLARVARRLARAARHEIIAVLEGEG